MAIQTSGLTRGDTWVVVANAARADIYVRHRRFGPLEAVQCLMESQARAKEQDLVADGPGRAFDSGGAGRHAMEPEHSEKEHLLMSFARRVAQALASARKSGRFGQLVIVAAPVMLGELRRHLDKATADCVTAEIDKELTDQNPETLAKLLDS